MKRGPKRKKLQSPFAKDVLVTPHIIKITEENVLITTNGPIKNNGREPKALGAQGSTPKGKKLAIVI